MRHLDLFSGIGGFALAASWVWGDEYENVGHCEIEEYACKVYHRHFPTSPHLGDITKEKWHEGQADIITGGFPCQPHSQAGKRLASKDERDLWYECKRAVSEIRPRYALFENVSGLLTSERGRFFNRVLSDLAEIGYDAEWHVIPASAVGAPHKRDRVWIIANARCEHGEGQAEQKEFVRKIGKRYATKLKRPTSSNGIRATSNADKDAGSRTTRSALIQRQILSQAKWEKTLNGLVTVSSWERDWLEVAATFCRVDDGLPNRVDRLAGLGNAIVPQVAQVILQAIKEADEP